MNRHEPQVTSVDPGSAADKAGICPGDALLAIDGEPVLDIVDYTFLTQSARLKLRLRDRLGEEKEVLIRKPETQPLGLAFDGLMSPQRRCRNRCVFCFEDQLPPGVRESLRAKDDDWRLSLMMGNFVTMTNVDDDELQRIIKRRVSPLYISVHATDPALRRRLMGNPKAGDILAQLQMLAQAGLCFHAQVVLCPGVNDGAALEQTLRELFALRPYALSCALVPVGLTRYSRANLTPYSPPQAKALLDTLEAHQKRYLPSGTRFVFAADEFYVQAGRPLPPEDAYEGFWQIENGVGMMRKFQAEWALALEEVTPLPGHVSLVTGVLAADWMRTLVAPLEAQHVRVDVIGVPNGFFGGGVSVAGLLTGSDILRALQGRALGEKVLLPRTLLRREGDMLLDDMTPDALQSAIPTPLQWVDVDGFALAHALAAPNR